MKYVKEVTYYVYLNPVFVNFAVAGPFDCLTLSVCLYDSQSDPVLTVVPGYDEARNSNIVIKPRSSARQLVVSSSSN